MKENQNTVHISHYRIALGNVFNKCLLKNRNLNEIICKIQKHMIIKTFWKIIETYIAAFLRRVIYLVRTKKILHATLNYLWISLAALLNV